ncbi:tautomerase family protein, partial [Aeromicrobium alkaliterrae]|uniref:tautomerase family protein n=1 Tax=Aeromicrobium alkaliterrae TaxID=302168 RepID=UPI0031E0975D
MPFIWVELAEGRSLEQRRSFAKAVTQAAVVHLGAPTERVAIRFLDILPTDFARGGVLTVDAQSREVP